MLARFCRVSGYGQNKCFDCSSVPENPTKVEHELLPQNVCHILREAGQGKYLLSLLLFAPFAAAAAGCYGRLDLEKEE